MLLSASGAILLEFPLLSPQRFKVSRASFVVFWGSFLATLCSILVPRPGMELVPPALEAWSFNHWLTRVALEWGF